MSRYRMILGVNNVRSVKLSEINAYCKDLVLPSAVPTLSDWSRIGSSTGRPNIT